MLNKITYSNITTYILCLNVLPTNEDTNIITRIVKDAYIEVNSHGN